MGIVHSILTTLLMAFCYDLFYNAKNLQKHKQILPLMFFYLQPNRILQGFLFQRRNFIRRK